MPSYVSSGFTPPPYPARYAQPKYDSIPDFRGNYDALHSASVLESDLDPYNHDKHAVYCPAPAPAPYDSFSAERQFVNHRLGLPAQSSFQPGARYPLRNDGYNNRRWIDSSHVKGFTAQDEKIIGGVSAQLDYEMDQMTDFVLEMTVSLIRPSTHDRTLFRKWVLQVLNATRLPSATIVLSLSYLSLRINGLKAGKKFFPTERGLYQLLTVALILGSKFLDDNTFQNKSWAEVSNISVRELNFDEMEWLAAFEHRLHMNPDMPDGFASWQGKWIAYKARPNLSVSSLLSIDTAIRGSRPSRQDTPSSAFAHQYPVSAVPSIKPESGSGQYTPSYASFDSWYNRSGSNRSPSTAPHSGPNTPDYYTAGARWGTGEPLGARDAQLGHSSLPHINDNGLFQSAYDNALYGYTTPSLWSIHGQSCHCANCRQTHVMQPRFGPLTAA